MICLAALLAAGCGGEMPSPLHVEPAARGLDDDPALLARVASAPHSYFRFINVAFAQAVCTRFRSQIGKMPAVNLHGDAHVEQYATTDHGRGLTDFDDSSAGPNVIDLVRFGVSLTLAAQQRGWNDRAGELVDAFLAGYRTALADPRRRPPEPAVIARMRARYAPSRAALFEEVNRQLAPIAFDRAAIERPLARYAETILAQHPDLPRHFFDSVAIDRLHAGLGSALDEKYIIRVQGATAVPDDDVLLEAKELRRLDGIDCLDTSRRADPFRILVVESRIAYTPHRYIGYARWRGKTFWIHAWDDHYAELDIAEASLTADHLREVAFDVGVQLGRGHPYQIADPLESQLRAELLDNLSRHQAALRAAIHDLAGEATAAWQRFRREAAPR